MSTTGNVVCQPGYGQVRYLASLPGANDALVLLFLQPTGQQDDDILRDYTTVSALLAGGNTECSAPGYIRHTVSSGVTITPDNVNNRVDVAAADVTFTALGTMTGTNARQEISALIIAYQANVSTGNDTTLQPLTKHYFPFLCDGSDRVVPLHNAFYRAAG